MTDPAQIACTLSPTAFADRREWLTRLNGESLRSHRRLDWELELLYAASAVPEVQELVRRESECCAFLRFTMEDGPGFVRLKIEVPPEAREASDLLLAPFLAGVHNEVVVGSPDTSQARIAEPIAGTQLATASCACASDQRAGSPRREREAGEQGSRMTSVVATTSAGFAVVCAVCCVLPLALPVVAVAMLGGVMATLAHLFSWARGMAIALVGSAWLWLAWRHLRIGRWPSASTIRGMSLATLLLVVALGWPLVESEIVAALRR